MSTSSPRIPLSWITERCAIVCRETGVVWEDFIGRGRHPSFVTTREIAFILCRFYRGPRGEQWPDYETIGASCRRPHSSVVTCVERGKANPDTMERVEAMVSRLGLVPNVDREPIKPGHDQPPDRAMPPDIPLLIRNANRLVYELATGRIKSYEEATHLASELWRLDVEGKAFGGTHVAGQVA